MPRMRFTIASHAAIVGSNVLGARKELNASASRPKTPASTSVIAGPAMDTRNWSPALLDSELICDTPPSSQSVMPSTF